MKEDKRYLNSKETARFLGISDMTLWRWVKKGLIPSYKVSRKRFFDKEELIEWMKEHKEKKGE